MGSKEKIPVDESPVVTSIWRLGGLKWKTLAKRVWNELYAGDLLTHAAALAFYFLFALFPLLVFLVTLLGFFVDRGSDLRTSLFGYLRRIVPPSAFVTINTTLDEISNNAGGARLSIGLIAALWFGSLGIAALSESLNAMYGVRESRPWWRVRASAIGLTAALVILILGALLLIVYGGEIGSEIADHFNQGTLFCDRLGDHASAVRGAVRTARIRSRLLFRAGSLRPEMVLDHTGIDSRRRALADRFGSAANLFTIRRFVQRDVRIARWSHYPDALVLRDGRRDSTRWEDERGDRKRCGASRCARSKAPR